MEHHLKQFCPRHCAKEILTYKNKNPMAKNLQSGGRDRTNQLVVERLVQNNRKQY